MLSTMWQQFGEDPFLFQLDYAPVYKATSIMTWFDKVGHLEQPTQNPDPNPIYFWE